MKIDTSTINQIHHLNCMDAKALQALPDNSIDSIVCDPPYGLSKPPNIEEVLRSWIDNQEFVHSVSGFMEREWDSFVPSPLIWQEVFRVLKHGGHLFAFAGTRTVDLMGISLRLAGFEFRDTFAWLYSQGMPKGVNVEKQIINKFGAERAKEWEGWHTSMKPAYEPIILARKPLETQTVAENVLKWRTGALNIDPNRIPIHNPNNQTTKGRFPSNVLLDILSAKVIDEQSGILKSGTGTVRRKEPTFIDHKLSGSIGDPQISYGDIGGASRFFYCAKPSKKEKGEGNTHITVKPLKLMSYLIKLITPPNGVVLDPFAGSGSTLVSAKMEGFQFIGYELIKEHVDIAEMRLQDVKRSDTTLF